jgi:uncharacterized protein (UPF0210 family)
MKIRSITYFDNLQWPLDVDRVQQASNFISRARSSFQDGGFEVQTTRLATPPFPLIMKGDMHLEAKQLAAELEGRLISAGFDYVSIGPALPDYPESYSVLPEVLANTQSIFVAGVISSTQGGIFPSAIKQCAKVIKQNAEISEDGFDNLRFAALANVPPGAPFFPAAYHYRDAKPAFAIATEAADLAVTATMNAETLDAARTQLIELVEDQAGLLTSIGEDLEARSGVKFSGLDFSLAPYPLAEQSIGTAIESMGVPSIGSHGSLAAVAILAEALERADYPRVGFSGVMLPLLEATVLAQRGYEGMLSVSDLLLYSAVCGTGLDTIPLPDDVSEEQLYAILLDLAVLAQRLRKPLTARLMPIPGRKAGEKTDFDFEFFANSKVLDLKAQRITGLLAGDDPYDLKNRLEVGMVDDEK